MIMNYDAIGYGMHKLLYKDIIIGKPGFSCVNLYRNLLYCPRRFYCICTVFVHLLKLLEYINVTGSYVNT